MKRGTSISGNLDRRSSALIRLWILTITCMVVAPMPLFSQVNAVPVMHKQEHNDCNSYVKIEGSTNVNRFYFQQAIEDPKYPQNYVSKDGYITLTIPIRKFEASNPLMYSDFFQLLQADAHPDITIRFYYDPYKLLNPGATATSISSEIWVSLAGEEKKFRLPGTVHVCYDNAAHLNGSLKIDLRDFNLTPPTKFMGMVKVNNEVSVEFAVRMSPELVTQK